MWRQTLAAATAGPRTGLRGGRALRRPNWRGFASWSCVETPNPSVRKFEWLQAAVPGAGTFGGRHLQAHLLSLDGVRDVFVSDAEQQWVAVTCAEGFSWEALAPRVQEALEALPMDGPDGEAGGAAPSDAAAGLAPTGVEAEILEVLTHRIRPGVQADGGDVELIRWEEGSGQVVLALKGACRGCPQSAVTLQDSILRTLTHFVPQVKTVVAEEEELDPDAPADPFADLPWAHDGQPDPKGIQAMAAAGTPFFSTFAGTKVEGRVLKRVKFMSQIHLGGRTPGHIFVACTSCGAKRTIEDPQDLLRADKGNATDSAAVVVCPTCCVVISK